MLMSWGWVMADAPSFSPIKVEIRRNQDGVIASYEEREFAFNQFWWQEGNASCDCNRHLFFERAFGREPDFDETECGEERYAVRISDLSTGAILYDEIGGTHERG